MYKVPTPQSEKIPLRIGIIRFIITESRLQYSQKAGIFILDKYYIESIAFNISVRIHSYITTLLPFFYIPVKLFQEKPFFQLKFIFLLDLLGKRHSYLY